MSKKEKLPKYRHQGNAQEEIAEIDYYKQLNHEEKKFLLDFQDGYYKNGHRKHEIFTSHPEYESRIKKELDGRTNARNRDLYSNMNVRKRLDSLDHLQGTVEEAVVSKLLLKELSKKEKEQLRINFGVDSFESCTERLMKETADTIKNNVSDMDPKYVLLNFYLTINSLIKDELKELRKAKKEALGA
jgi:hypothetical protein